MFVVSILLPILKNDCAVKTRAGFSLSVCLYIRRPDKGASLTATARKLRLTLDQRSITNLAVIES